MKRFFLFFFASLLSISMFAAGESGKTKAQAIPYDWSTGIHVSSEAGVGKWYVVMLKKQDGGPFNENGKTDAGLTNINVSVVNPLAVEADIDVIAYIGDNETNRHFKLAAGGIKSMTFGAGMFIKMGIDRVYLYLVMDVTITPEEAEHHEAVNVNVTPVESENTVVFNPINFNWTGWPSQTTGVDIPANTETWVKFDFEHHQVENGYTYKFYVDKTGAGSTTLHAGLSYDCPATNIQTQDKELTANTSKILDDAKLSILPDVAYVRLKADQALHIYAEQVAIPAPEPGTDPIFNINGAIEVKTYDGTDATVYTLNAENKRVYFVQRGTLKAEEYYYKQIEVTNNGDDAVTIIGKASKNPDTDGNVWSVVSKSVTIPAHQTYVKKIDKSMQNVVGTADDDVIWAQGPLNSNITFKLTNVPEDPDYCQPAQAEALTLLATGQVVKAQSAGTQWYKVDITAAMTAKTDITLTLESDQEVNVTIDVAAECALGEPTQTYTGKSTSTTKTLSYSVIKDVKEATDEHYYVFVRVKTDKAISVKAELVPVNADIIWDGTKWSNQIGPKKDKAAYIQGPLTVTGGQIIEASSLNISYEGSITIKSGASVFVGNGGISIAAFSQGVTVEDGGMLLISPECTYTYNAEPEVKVHKTLHLGQQEKYYLPDQDDKKATLPDLHEFIAVPVSGAYDVEARYNYWDRVSGWKKKKSTSEDPTKACSPFVGYNVFTKSTDAHYGDYDAVFEGKLAPNKNQSFTTGQIGWYAFGNSWLAPIKLSYLLDALAEKYTSEGQTGEANQKAVHTYVASPMQVPGLPNEGKIKDNYYIPLTAEIAANIGVTEIAPMQGFFLFTEEGATISVDYTKVWNDATGYGSTPNAAPKHNRVADERNKAAVVFNGGGYSDFVYMIEGSATNANKMVDANLAIYAENGLGQVAKDNLIGTTLTIKTNAATEYTLSFGWLNGETMYLRDLKNGVLIPMTEGNKYTFTAEPNTTSVRFQVVGRNNVPTGMEQNAVIEGVNKTLENGNVVIIKNGVKYNVMGAQL